MAFHPSTITVPVGTTVTWSNNDTINHSIVSDQGNELNSSVIPPSQTFSHAFNAVGTFAYHCSFHPSMMGTVIVTSGGASSASSSSVPSFACFEPSTTEGDAPLGVFFDPFCSDASVNHWSWDFDDGETSTDPSPFHVFVDPGSYDVTLTVASPTGSGSIVHTITASGAIVSSSSSSVSGAVCGNGTKEAGEECDDGNTNDNDACFANCRWAVPPSVLP
jgi:cysteine-rich repeat protein